MKYKHLTIEEREVIDRILWEKRSVRSIAKELNRSPSSVSREIKRHYPAVPSRYSSRLANEKALKNRKSRGRKDRLKNERIRTYVKEKLKLRWSPEQIAGRIRIDLGEKISHEAIYQYIYAQCCNGSPDLRKGREDLRIYLRRRRKRRQTKGARKGQRIFKPKGNSIDLRPEIVNQRLRVGDWEGDTVESKDHKPGINTLVERKTGLVLITKLNGRGIEATNRVVAKRFSSLPEEIKYTLTLDNGTENNDWQGIEELTGLKVFYAHEYHSWERGTNENTNGLARDYWPKKTDFCMISDEEIAQVEYLLNTRPRKRLGWLSPLEALSVAITG